MERETLAAQTGTRAGTAQLTLTMGLCVLHEAFWAGINCFSLQQKGAPLGSGAELMGGELRHESRRCSTLGKGTGVILRDP